MNASGWGGLVPGLGNMHRPFVSHDPLAVIRSRSGAAAPAKAIGAFGLPDRQEEGQPGA